MAIEDPTYVGVFDLLQARGLKAFPISMDLLDDPTAEFSRLLAARRPRALLLVPAVHSPTGRVRRSAPLAALAAQLDHLGVPTIEDNTVADLVFTGTRPPSLGSLCRRATVMTIESTSKVAWGGLRVGWIHADPAIINTTITQRARTDYGTSVPSQLIALQILGRYDTLISRRRRALENSATTFTDLVRTRLPDWKWEAPAGGLSAWIDTGMDAGTLANNALHHRVAIATGTSASRSRSAQTHIRACFDRSPVELEAAIIRLARAVDDTRGYRTTP